MMGRWTWIIGLVALSFSFSLYQRGFAEERYTVKQGDSLYAISKTVGVPVEALKKANGLGNDRLRLKQVLVIPAQGDKPSSETTKKRSSQSIKKSTQTAKNLRAETESYTVQKGDSLYTISKKAGLSIEEVKKTNRLASTALKTGQILVLPKLKTDTEEEGEDLDEGDEEEGTGEEGAEGEETGRKQENPEPVGAWKSPEERNLFIRVVKTFLGVPYRLGGSTLKGIDCSAFVKKIYEIFNIQLPRTTWEQFRIGKRVGKSELEEGDLVFFKTRTRRANNAHVGIYIGNNQFVHASSHNREVKVDNLDTPYFNQRFLNGIRVKELRKGLTL